MNRIFWFLIYLTLIVFIVLLVQMPDKETDVDIGTKKLCRWYADRDHELELAPDRWQWFLDQGIDPNTHFDWYKSCINHTRYPVAK